VAKALHLRGGETASGCLRNPVYHTAFWPPWLHLLARDAAVVFLAALAAPMDASWHFRVAVGLSVAVLTAGLGCAHGGYGELAGTGRREMERCIGDFFAALVMMRLMAGLLDRGGLISAVWLIADGLFSTAALVGVRLARFPAENRLRRAGGTVVILGGEADERGVEAALAARGIAGGVAGVFCVNGAAAQVRKWPVIHQAHLQGVLRAGRIRDVVFVGRPEILPHGAEIFGALFHDVFGLPARVWLAVDLAAAFPGAVHGMAGRYRLVPMLGEHTLDASDPLKRLFDMVFSAALLAVLAPVMAAIAAALWLTGTRHVLYRQKRAGAGGRMFYVLKFRTMNVPDDAEFLQAVLDDPRVTWLGRFLRRTSLDELPQLVNVLRGDMSLVGPRPHAPDTTVAGLNFEDAAKFYRLRYRVKPGMTGLAQIRGQRGATGDILSLEQRVSSDLEYIETWSLWLDFLILLRTIPAVLRPCNAY
jgi:exopolysaccharide biosynthesis polyprenyl glycosylphosphotransferase